MDQYNMYFKGKKMINKNSQSLAFKIIKLGLKQGDKITLYPFNYFNDEDTEHVSKNSFRHDKILKIKTIDIIIIDSWNGSVKARFDIFLE